LRVCFGFAERLPPGTINQMGNGFRATFGGLGSAGLRPWGVGAATLGCVLVVSTASASSASASAWSLQAVPRPTISELDGVSCASRDFCIAVGSIRNKRGRFTLVERWNGARWSIERSPNPTGSNYSALYGVSCTSSRFCVAVGYSVRRGGPAVTGSVSRAVMLVARWDGRQWSLQPVADPAGAQNPGLSAVSCTSRRACTAVGSSYSERQLRSVVVERWDGFTWSSQRIRAEGPYELQDAEFSGVSCTSANSCTAVGTYSNQYFWLEGHWNGSGWSIQTDYGDLNAVSCISRTACVAVGSTCCIEQGVLIEGWNQRSSYNPQITYGSPTLNGVSCTSKRACTAVGMIDQAEPVLVERWDGTRWRDERPPFRGELTAVSCTSDTVCTAVGDGPIGAIVARYS
jgi:hypothetical protein